MYSPMALLFTMGGISGFLIMCIHSFIYDDKNSTTVFIFGGGVFLALALEVTLVKYFHAYDYVNLPLSIFTVPIVIPMGWVVTFYGISKISQDYLCLLSIEESVPKLSAISGLIAILFGLAIEVIARNSNFWIFYFEAVELGGVPIIVTLAWGFSVAAFVAGVEWFKNQPRYWVVILFGVHLINISIAYILLQFSTLGN